MELDRNGIEVLSRDDSLSLLTTVPVGRIGLSMDALPVVLPVNYALDRDGERLVLRTAEGTKLRAALHRSVVAFEADHIDPFSHTGWSVLVRGSSCVLTDGHEIERARRLPLRPWANEHTDYWVAVSLDLVTGRRVRGWYDLPTPLVGVGGASSAA
jgi:nitroimidazol reductase NimA-like FMN-containing flavoprotein (pyridoxamine 5'-phosphate oxidase superfamily)